MKNMLIMLIVNNKINKIRQIIKNENEKNKKRLNPRGVNQEFRPI